MSDEEIPNYENWQYKKENILKTEDNSDISINKDNIDDDQDNIPDYSNWNFNNSTGNIKNLINLIEKENINQKNSKEKEWKFLSNGTEEEESSEDEDSKLSYDEWKKRKNINEKNSLKNEINFPSLLKVNHF
jgi:hypothetical protein